MEKKVKIIVTGGHLSPMVSVIESMRALFPSWEIVCIGRKYALEQDKKDSAEFFEMNSRSIRFLPLTTGRFTRNISLNSFLSFLKIPIGFIQAFLYVWSERPNCICSFGGYIGLPVGIAGWLLGIPLVTHEQTHTLGLSNRCLMPIADILFLTYSETKFVNGNNHIVSGLPLRNDIMHPPQKVSFDVPPGRPIIYITGGTTGAVTLNEIIFPVLEKLLSKATIIHQVGEASIKKAVNVKKTLPANMKKYYMPLAYINSSDVSWIFHHMDLLIGRSGANTVFEVAYVGKRAIFVPLPWSGQREQQENALWYRKTGNGSVFDQEKETAKELVALVERELGKKPNQVTRREPEHAANIIVKHIHTLITSHDQ